jgi:RimJ/RimL family protein N-acetyltransferase
MTAAVLLGSRVTLRPPTHADVASRVRLGTDPEIHRMYGGSRAQFGSMTIDRAAQWLAGLEARPHGWVITIGDRMIGEAFLHAINDDDRRAMFAIGIADPAELGRGYGTEATRLVLHHAFKTLDLHRVGLRVLAYNERAIACYKKCGFLIEGCERESALVDGEWHDDILMGILASDFTAQLHDATFDHRL